MPIFKYDVANKEGKKLSGTVEAPDEQTAREELNNLGFSILTLQETQAKQKEDPSKTKFAFDATDKTGKLINGTVPAKTKEEALAKLKDEYSLTVNAIWPQDATPEQIEEAKKTGAINLQEETEKAAEGIKDEKKTEEEEDEEETLSKDPQQRKKELEIKTKIDTVLNEVHNLLQTFDKEFDPAQKSEIQKRIDKLLRIKNSKNLEYILTTAKDLLEFIKNQAEKIEKPGREEEKFRLKMETDKIMGTLKKGERKGVSENILEKIDKWQQTHKSDNLISQFLNKTKNVLTAPPEVTALKEKIKTLNKSLYEFGKMYFKEPTPEYKEKAKANFKKTWQARKTTIAELKALKTQLKEKRKGEKIEENLFMSFLEELNALTGWLLAFYIIYYFGALYLNTKDFGLAYVPEGFEVYTSQIFKYILSILFLLHSATALKVNFFRKSILATVILIPVFILGSIVTLLNF